MRDFTWLVAQLAANQDLAIQFWTVFSRLEYALKRENYAIGDAHSVFAHWERLATDLDGVWDGSRTRELGAAVDYLCTNPPRKQTLQGGVLVYCFSGKWNFEARLITSNPSELLPSC